MGGFCCCYSRRTEPNNAHYLPRISEERQPLAAQQGAASGLLVVTDLERSVPDTYRPPPAPIPYDVDIRRPQLLSETRESHDAKSDNLAQMANADSTEGLVSVDTPRSPEKDLEEIGMGKADLDLNTSKDLGNDELKKPCGPIVSILEEEECCPICLEEYDEENPKMVAQCGHHFHLACILEWMERSETCAMCDKEMIIDEAISV